MPLVLAVMTLGLATALAPVAARLLGRNAGYPLAALYLLAAGILVPPAGAVLSGNTPSTTLPWVPSLGVDLALRFDGLGLVFATIALLIGAVVLLYSTKYLAAGERHTSFFVLMAAFTVSMLGLVMADDLVVLFICWELTSLASFFLIARSGREAEGPSMRTLLLTFIGGLFLLTAVASIWARLGTTDLGAILAADIWQTDPTFRTVIALLVALAACTKSAQFPFHSWLPDAMAAITPVSAYLHAAAVVKAGIFLLLRFSPIFHDDLAWQVLLVTAGLITTVIGGWFALQQTDLKRLMAYSTVSQLGLIVATIGIGTEAALTAAIIHTIAHAMFKAGLFMMVGVVDHATHTRDVGRMPTGLYRKLPVSFTLTLLGAASMAGIPPLLGFVSKEAMFDALLGEGHWTGWAALVVAAAGAVLTLSYCLKLVLGAFVDGPDDERPVEAQNPWLVIWAGLPIAASVPLVFMLAVIDAPLAAATTAAFGEASAPHLALWHGVNAALLATLAVLVAGIVVAVLRRRVLPAVEALEFPVSGVEVLGAWNRGMQRLGHLIDRPVAADHATRHVASILGSLGALGILGVASVARSLPPQQDGLGRPIDWIVAGLMLAAVLAVCVARSRIAATVALSTVGVLATVQILSLGAPDVAMTQLLVESLNIIVIMLVLQKLPMRFPRRSTRGNVLTALGSIGVGAGVAALVWASVGRRERSDLARYFLDETYAEAGGHNVVNIILVEFRAFDTLGELSVLGMAGVAIVAIYSTIQAKRLEPVPLRERIAARRDLPLNPDRDSTAYRAMQIAWPNNVGLQMMLRVAGPVLVIVSALLFWRGHNSPGGGFNAALVAAALVGLIYLSTSRDRQIGPPRVPLYLIGGGIITAVVTGLIGFVARGSFLAPIHGYLAGVHLTTSMIFDVGVYLAVLGLMMLTFNLLGTSAITPEHGEGTRERADEAVEGELPGPLEPIRGQAKRRVGPRTRHITAGTRPKEPGR